MFDLSALPLEVIVYILTRIDSLPDFVNILNLLPRLKEIKRIRDHHLKLELFEEINNIYNKYSLQTYLE